MTIGDSVGQKNALYINKVGEGSRWKNCLGRWQAACLTALFLVSASFFAACSESDGDDSNEYADWQSKNEAYFSNIYNQAKADKTGKWKILTNWSVNDAVAKDVDHIVVEVLQNGTGSGCPLFTDSVRVHYRGQLIPTAQHPKGGIFDTSYSGELDVATAVPVKFAVSNVRDGFSTALQNMHIGDRWLVHIPYDLMYGAGSDTGYPAYSNMVFDIALVDFCHPGEKRPAFRSRQK
jgi:FKBP-type peptidyl-prolyl cis-trans isomerase FklB